MRPTWLRVDGLRTRLVLVFIAIVVIIAGATAGVVSFMARSWIYSNAQDVATAQFRDELQYSNGPPVDGLTPDTLDQIFQSDMTLIVDGEVIRQGSVDAATIPPSFEEGLDSPKLIRFERLDSQRIMLGMSVNVVDMTADDGYDNETLVKAVTIRPLVGVQDKFDDLLRAVGLTLAAGVLVSGLLGLWIASTLVRPLKRLDEAAARAADGDLSVRLPEDGVAELAQVTTTFNNMVARNEAVIRGLEESEEQSRRFVADVSHELRTPLAALVPVSEILREEIP
ncbi:HAMP domain-containing protein, partial [Rhodococcus erythropolis]|nr:HAMP domain-containing protein [Rhodococcus erythropolis]